MIAEHLLVSFGFHSNLQFWVSWVAALNKREKIYNHANESAWKLKNSHLFTFCWIVCLPAAALLAAVVVVRQIFSKLLLVIFFGQLTLQVFLKKQIIFFWSNWKNKIKINGWFVPKSDTTYKLEGKKREIILKSCILTNFLWVSRVFLPLIWFEYGARFWHILIYLVTFIYR